MNNPLITTKELGLIKGALRRIFSRSEHRKKVLEACTVPHTDENRPRVGKWGACAVCGEVTPRYLLVADHILPVVRITETLEQLPITLLIDRIWCSIDNLQPICKECHNTKSQAENRERRKYKKWLKTQNS